jgi:acetyltransferase-like isoleucine patch superfamily enzyme
LFNKFFKPEIIGGFQTKTGVVFRNVRISNTTHIGNQNNLILGDNVFIGHFNYIDTHKTISIAEGVQITNFVSILTHSSHHAIRLYGKSYVNNVSELKGLKEGSVEIGEYTYIGPHCTIMPGSKIGKGSIVSAYSYVNGEFPAYSILRGQPAKIVGNTNEIDNEMLEKHPELSDLYCFKNERNLF